MARGTENPRQGSAREQARKMQEEQERKQRRSSVLLRIGVVFVAVVIVAGLVFWVVNRNGGGDDAAATEGPAPTVANDQGGFTLTADGEISGGADLGTIDASDVPEHEGDLPEGVVEREEGEPPHVVIYVDANCVHCADFEQQNSDQLEQWVDDGQITLEYRPVGFLDGNSSTNYSSRAANAFACMAEESPENYQEYVGSVVANQPNGELSNDELAAWAEDYDVDISQCISDGTYRAFASYSTSQAQANGITGTPTVYVDDVDWAESETAFPELVQSHIDEYEDEAA